jgi:hypothetical protein
MYTKGSGITIKQEDLEFIRILMEPNMLDSGKMINRKELENKFG